MIKINKNLKLEGKTLINPVMPDANWNISALFAHDPLIFDFISLLAESFQTRHRIESVHGSPPIRWNSGRMAGRTITASEIEALIQSYAEWEIEVFFTFSNHFLKEEDLKDETANFMLKTLQQYKGGGVILSSELLSQYLRESYPDLKQYASVVKTTMEKGKAKADYYLKLAEKYDRVVIHPDDNFNEKLLKELADYQADCFEILVNEPCLINCANRIQHYSLIARSALDIQNALIQEELEHFTTEICESIPFGKQLGPHNKRRNCSLSQEELQNIYQMGFRHFKLQGRNYGSTTFLFDLCHYLLENEYAAPLIFKTL